MHLTTSYKFCDVKIVWADYNHTIKRIDGAFTYGWEVSLSAKTPKHWLDKISSFQIEI